MSKNSERMREELAKMGYKPNPFTTPKEQGSASGVSFEYQIEDGSRAGETVTLAIAVCETEGEWPEITPHWLYISPPDTVLAEQVKGSHPCGSIEIYQYPDDRNWMAVSAPPSDFWDKIDTSNGKNMKTYLDRHIRRIWSAR